MELFDYAYIMDFEQKIVDLKNLAIPETWSRNGTNNNSILKSYIQHYFRRLNDENKVKTYIDITTNQTYSVFNTGLLTSMFEEIYAVFTLNRIPNRQPWFFHSFSTDNNPILAHIWTYDKPMLANFFSKKEDIIFDTGKQIILQNRHILEDNYNRINHNGKSIDELLTSINGSLQKASKMIARNFKIAIPQFFKDRNAGSGEIQFLIPVYFGAISIEPDAILAVKENNGIYIATTCLTMEMAYNNARLISKPSNEWLS